MVARSPDRSTRIDLSGQPRKRRPAPPVATENAEAARRNIDQKTKLVARYLARESGELQPAEALNDVALELSDLPASVRQFNLWESAALRADIRDVVPSFSKNSNATLRKNHDLHQLVVRQLAALTLCGTPPAQKQEATKSALLRRLAIANHLRAIAEKELIRSRREVMNHRDRVRALEAELNSTAAKSREEMGRLNEELASLKTENRRLLAAAKRTNTLRSV